MLVAALAADPDDWRSSCLLARANLELGDAKNALDVARRAIALAPEQEWPHRLASLALSGQGKHKEALVEARASAERAPHSWQALHTLSGCRLRTDAKSAEAWQTMTAMLAVAPDEPLALTQASRILQVRGDSEGAQRALAQAAATDPTNPEVHNTRGLLALQGKDSVGALQGFGSALASDPRARAAMVNFKITLYGVVRRVSVGCFIGVAFIGRAIASNSNVPIHTTGDLAAPRAASAILGAGIFLYAAVTIGRVLLQLEPNLRAAARRVALADVRMCISLGTVLVASACYISASFAPRSDLSALIGVAAVSALVGFYANKGVRPRFMRLFSRRR